MNKTDSGHLRPDLIEELINCIVIMDSDFKIRVMGQRIYKKLCSDSLDLGESFLEHIPKDEVPEIKKKFNTVLSNWTKDSFTLKSVKLTGFLIPMVFGETRVVVIVDERCFLRAKKLEHDLKERMKELRCLYTIGSKIVSEKSLEKLMTISTKALIRGFQYPVVATSVIELDGKKYTVRPLPEESIRCSLSSHIEVNGKKRGSVKVSYTEDKDFIPEERDLLNEVSRMLAKAIEGKELEKELKKYVGNLEELVEEKTKELEKSNKRYSELFEYAPDGIVISTFEGDIYKANRAFYRMLNYPEDGSVQLKNYVHNNLYDDIKKDRDYIIEKLKKDGRLEGYEFNLRDSNGNPCPVIGSFILIEIDGKLYDEAIYKDVRLRKELEKKLIVQKENLEKIVKERTVDLEGKTKKLSNSMNKLKTLFNAITDTVVMVDRDFNIQMSNRKAIKNCTCYEAVFNRNKPCEDCPAIRAFETKETIKVEKKVNNDYYRLQAYPIISDDGEVEGVLEFSRLITQEKEIEMQLLQADKLASLGQLVSGIAHEINNPNTFIRGNIIIIEEAIKDILPILDEKYKNEPGLKIARLKYNIFKENIMVLVDDMLKGANRIKSIVSDLRKFARRDEGLLNDDIDINVVVESCLRLVRNQIKRNSNIKLELDLDIPSFKGNIQKIEQVVVNMLINASQAIEKERGTIRISTLYDKDKKEVRVEISDDGKGMDPNTVKQIFNPFFTTKRTRGGTGLGLSIAYGIIKEHNGIIDVDSEVGRGTTFTIRLPAK